MADERIAAKVRDTGLWPLIKKRWRAWLRAFHRDFGYLAIGFTVIYAVSGIAQNHIEDWGEVSYRTYETTKTIAPIADELGDDEAIAKVAALVDFGKPTSTFRAGDEIRLEYASGAKVTAIGEQVTIQGRERRAFIGVANWLHTARNKKGWRYVADVYAILLLYLAISGIFMIKGKLGLKGRGAFLISAGVAVPIAAVLMSGPDARKAAPPATIEASKPGDGIQYLPTEDSPREEAPSQMPVLKQPPPDPVEPVAAGSGSGSDVPKPSCDPFGNMHGCAK
jgi:hypothetical protein